MNALLPADIIDKRSNTNIRNGIDSCYKNAGNSHQEEDGELRLSLRPRNRCVQACYHLFHASTTDDKTRKRHHDHQQQTDICHTADAVDNGSVNMSLCHTYQAGRREKMHRQSQNHSHNNTYEKRHKDINLPESQHHHHQRRQQQEETLVIVWMNLNS